MKLETQIFGARYYLGEGSLVEAAQGMMEMGMESEMLISDDETMLVGDDFIMAESDFNKQKEEENNNAFVKIENDPRVTKVGKFIRKYSIDELP